MKPSQNSNKIDEVLTLAAQLRAGDTAVESLFLIRFEALADRLALDDPARFVTLVEAMQDVSLQTAVARQKVAYYYATALRRDGRYQAAVQAFATLLTVPDLEPSIHGRVLNSQAIGYRLLGEPEKAISNYQKSLTIWQQLQDAENQGKVCLNLGIMAYELRHYDEAEQYLQRALGFLQPLHLSKLIAIAHNELGLINRDRGKWAAALDYFNRFVNQRQADGASDNVAVGLTNIGEVNLYQGNLIEAEQYLQEALALMQAPEYRIDMLLHLGLAHQARGDYQQAETVFAEALVLATKIERREFLPYLHYHLGDIHRLLGDKIGAVAEWETAVVLIENSRELIQDETIRISLQGRWQQIYEALLLQSLADNDVNAAFDWAERARARTFAEGLAADFNEVATLADLQSVLPKDTAVLCYFTTGVLAWDVPMLQAIPEDNPLREHILLPPKIILFVVTKTETAVHICPIDPNKFATASPRGQDITRYLQPAVSQRLYGSLLAPAGGGLHADHLVLIPHGPLHHVPFTAVLDHQPGQRPLLTLAPSGTVWWQQQIKPAKSGIRPSLAIGYPGENLHFAAVEATAVAELTHGDVHIGQIDKEWLRQTAVKRRLLHFACHAKFEDGDPLSSYLELGTRTRLTAREVLSDWHLTAEVVVLSACQTGLSHILRGDEPMGLIRAFLSAGAQSVLVTQWPVDDLATFLLITNFYQRLVAVDELSVNRALYQAQTWLRQVTVAEIEQVLARGQTPEVESWLQGYSASEVLFSEPYYWAGFILVGS